MASYKKMKVKDLRVMLDKFVQQGLATEESEVWLSSDEEGNEYGPLIQMADGQYNAGVEKDKSMVTLYPISMY